MAKKRSDVTTIREEGTARIELDLVRATEKTWNFLHPEEQLRFEDVMVPRNMLDAIVGEKNMMDDLSEERDDVTVHQLLLDDGYEQWLDGRDDSRELETEYVTQPGSAERGERAAEKEGMNISEWHYALVTCANDAEHGADAVLPERTRDAIKGYIGALCGNDAFSVYVSRYMVMAPTLLSDMEQFESMADAYLDAGADVRCGKYEKLDNAGLSTDGMLSTDGIWPAILCVPVTVRETHGAEGFSRREILSYAYPDRFPPERRHVGRCLWGIDLDDPGMEGILPFQRSEAGALFTAVAEAVSGAECVMDNAVLIPFGDLWDETYRIYRTVWECAKRNFRKARFRKLFRRASGRSAESGEREER